jgi:hypothetical protein
MEAIDIGLNELDSINLNFDDRPSSNSNFGAGIELLMNEKKISNNASSIGLGDLDKMESELRGFDMDMPSYKTNEYQQSNGGGDKQVGGFAEGVLNMFGLGNNDTSAKNVHVDTSSDNNDSRLGEASKYSMSGNAKTWDGFAKFNEMPSSSLGSSASSGLNERQLRRRKREMLNKLDLWYKKGLTQNSFDMNSSYEEIEDEYESILEEKKKQESVKLQGWWFMTFVNSIEYANTVFNPFDLNLDGWSDTVSEDLENYESIFEELHEKYKGGKLAPELQLLLRLGFSAAMANFANKALSTATPGFNDAIRHSPQLMKQFTDGVANAMSETSPAMSFLSNLVGGNSPEQVNTAYGMPPKPVETRSGGGSGGGKQPMQFTKGVGDSMSGNGRPDISMARGAMFREEGMDMNTFSSVNGGDSSVRKEMRGPKTDVDAFLSNLKTRAIDIHNDVRVEDVEGDSLMSRTSMRDFDGNMPKRSNRRQRNTSGKTVSLDI